MLIRGQDLHLRCQLSPGCNRLHSCACCMCACSSTSSAPMHRCHMQCSAVCLSCIAVPVQLHSDFTSCCTDNCGRSHGLCVCRRALRPRPSAHHVTAAPVLSSSSRLPTSWTMMNEPSWKQRVCRPANLMTRSRHAQRLSSAAQQSARRRRGTARAQRRCRFFLRRHCSLRSRQSGCGCCRRWAGSRCSRVPLLLGMLWSPSCHHAHDVQHFRCNTLQLHS